MKNNFKKYHKKPFFFSLALLALACFAFFFVYRKIQSNNDASAQAQATWQAEADKRGELKSLDRSLKDVAAERATLDTHFIQGSDVVPFLDLVEKLGPEVGADAQVSTVEVSKDNSGLDVSIKATGTFVAVYKFLNMLENAPYEISFSIVDFENSSASGAGWSLDLKIKLLSFIP